MHRLDWALHTVSTSSMEFPRVGHPGQIIKGVVSPSRAGFLCIMRISVWSLGRLCSCLILCRVSAQYPHVSLAAHLSSYVAVRWSHCSVDVDKFHDAIVGVCN
jgi:hypothetical protein